MLNLSPGLGNAFMCRLDFLGRHSYKAPKSRPGRWWASWGCYCRCCCHWSHCCLDLLRVPFVAVGDAWSADAALAAPEVPRRTNTCRARQAA